MSTAKSHFELLGVGPHAPLDEIKRGYRTQMARYHPDKLQHLGQEFVDLAVRRATELTQAYEAVRRQREHPELESTVQATEPDVTDGQAVSPPAASTDGGFEDEFLRSAALTAFGEAVRAVVGPVESRRVAGFEVAFASEAKRGFFQSSVPPFLLLARLVPDVDARAVEEAWRVAARQPGDADRVRALFVMGPQLGPANELADAISAQRRRPIRAGAGMFLVPVDLRTWRSLVPADAPAAIKAIIDRFGTR